MMNHVTYGETADSAYKGLYRLGGAAALIVAVLTLGEVIGLALYPQPGTVVAGSHFCRAIGSLGFWTFGGWRFRCTRRSR